MESIQGLKRSNILPKNVYLVKIIMSKCKECIIMVRA